MSLPTSVWDEGATQIALVLQSAGVWSIEFSWTASELGPLGGLLPPTVARVRLLDGAPVSADGELPPLVAEQVVRVALAECSVALKLAAKGILALERWLDHPASGRTTVNRHVLGALRSAVKDARNDDRRLVAARRLVYSQARILCPYARDIDHLVHRLLVFTAVMGVAGAPVSDADLHDAIAEITAFLVAAAPEPYSAEPLPPAAFAPKHRFEVSLAQRASRQATAKTGAIGLVSAPATQGGTEASVEVRLLPEGGDAVPIARFRRPADAKLLKAILEASEEIFLPA